jgi:hypothetical protein
MQLRRLVGWERWGRWGHHGDLLAPHTMAVGGRMIRNDWPTGDGVREFVTALFAFLIVGGLVWLWMAVAW